MAWYEDSYWRPYVSVAQRRAMAAQELARLRKKGVDVQPVAIEGRKIARTFWGQAWCEHLESYSDYANRLPRGRSYVCNGSVCHLAVSEGKVEAKVMGSELYAVQIAIATLPAAKWKQIKARSAGQIGSMLELLRGKLSDRVMEIVTDRDEGLFPAPKEIKLSCSCPDSARMCKHVAAALYGVGARLDKKPELLFALRGVDHQELLVSEDAAKAVVAKGAKSKGRTLDAAALGDVFGIDLAADAAPAEEEPKKLAPRTAAKKKAAKKKAAKKSAKKKAVKKKTAKKA